MHWEEDPAKHLEKPNSKELSLAAEAGAEIVCLPELTLSRYPADKLPTGRPADIAEDLEAGPTLPVCN